MKRYLKTALFAVLIGIILAFLFFLDIKKEVEAIDNDLIYVFQVGVFKNEDNANAEKQKYKVANIYYDEEYYRVFIAVSDNLTVVEKLSKFFDGQQINYYIKEYNKNITLDFENYNNILLKTDNRDIIYKINKSVLDDFLHILT